VSFLPSCPVLKGRQLSDITISLPWPPTANTYWRRRGNIYFISPKGLAYRNNTILECYNFRGCFSEDKRLRVIVEAFPPDKRRRDIDNIFKVLLDSLQYAKVYEDDSQIDYLCVQRMPDFHGKVLVHISCI